MMQIEKAERLKKLPPYLFKEINRQKEEVRSRGVDIIDLGVGDPDLPTPPHIIETLREAAADPSNHRYPSYSGMDRFNEAVAKWYHRRFAVNVDSATEVVTLIGSKEGLAHIPLAFVSPGDIALVPSPAYPVYDIAVQFAGGRSVFMDLIKDNDFLPDLDAISEETARQARLMFLNYPNNPTSATASIGFFNDVAAFAKKYGIIVCHDAAYTELSFGGYRPPSFMQADGAMEVGIEFHSLSKTYNMTGWRLGFAVGRKEIVQALGQIKSNIDSGAFQAIQIAGIAALEGDQSCVQEAMETYRRRRDVLVDGLTKLGLRVTRPKATFYLWIETPDGYTSAQFTSHLLTKAGIVVTPGNGFGTPGEGYVRMVLTVGEERLQEALNRIQDIGF